MLVCVLSLSRATVPMVTSVLLRCLPLTVRMLPTLFPPDMLNATESKSAQMLHFFPVTPNAWPTSFWPRKLQA
jgi:hypothetical protein